MKEKPIAILTIKCAVNKDGEHKYAVKTKHYDFFVWHDRKKSWYWPMEKVIEKLKKLGG